ncbi:PQ loop repeat-domain-containing protein [Phaeosphaeriaceae sp. PMI808]|nr:PQ loop repeat-domain-containing protein [Phaeosphaeriaceae sp. PMI808]
MFPPSQGLRLDIDAISQIFGSISIACWIVVFSPQIIENWKRSSAEGLSVVFIVVWLLGDFFNIIGAVLQGVLPTMIILAVYYTLADIVLLLQCFWYKGFTLRDDFKKPDDDSTSTETTPSERSPLLQAQPNSTYANINSNGQEITRPRISDIDRRHSSHSQGSFRERYLSIDGTHLSPVTPLHDDPSQTDNTTTPHPPVPNQQPKPASRAPPQTHPTSPPDSTLHFNTWGQISGYVCAILYLGSRVPQLLLNYRRKSTEGISMLFFLFACLGNLTYVLSIVVYEPQCRGKHGLCRDGEARAVYGRYIAVNFSWLLGSFGTLVLDACVFVQYFMYRKEEDSDYEEDEEDE